MKLSNKKTGIKTIFLHEDMFCAKDDNGLLFARAGIMVSKGCPDSERDFLLRAMRLGWIEPVAYVKDEDYTWELLQRE
jgi:hypothetical protein